MCFDRFIHASFHDLVGLFSHVIQRALGGVNGCISCIVRFDSFFALPIFAAVFFRCRDHALNLLFREAGGALNGDILAVARGFVLCCHVEDTVCVQVEDNFDLWHTARGRWDSIKHEFTQAFVVSRHGSFALHHINFDRTLHVGSGGKPLALVGRYGGVSLNQRSCHSAQSFKEDIFAILMPMFRFSILKVA